MNNIDILEEKEKKAIRMCDVLFISLDEIYKDGAQEYRMYYKTIKNLIETLIAKNKELKEQEDYTSVYLKGVYDEREKWQNKIKAKIEEVKDGTYDAKIVLQSLLGKE